jgi:urea carboxylase
VAARAEVTSSVWQIVAQPGTRVAAGERLLILESMKMEIAVVSPVAGVVRTIAVREQQLVAAGQIVAVVATSPGES